MKITGLEAITVRATDQPAHDNHEAVVVIITAEDGTVGLGEAHGHAGAISALFDPHAPPGWASPRTITDIVVGQSALDPRALWRELYAAQRWHARVGLGHAALAAVDIALWDLAARVAGTPVAQLLASSQPAAVTPYVTLYPGPGTVQEVARACCALLDQALALGITAVKVEPLPEAAKDDDEVVELIRRVRTACGDDIQLIVDFSYRFGDWRTALRCLQRIEEFNPILIETPLHVDDTHGYRELTARGTAAIGGAEILTSLAEFLSFADATGIRVVQPNVCCLGISETDRLIAASRSRGVGVMLHGWLSTTIGLAASIHLASAHGDHVSFVEYAPPSLYPGYTLRRYLAGPEPELRDGRFVPPTAPGLGVSLDIDALDRYRVRPPGRVG